MKKIFQTILLLLSVHFVFSQVDTVDCDYPDRDTTEAESLPWPVDIYSVQIFDGSSWAAILLSVLR